MNKSHTSTIGIIGYGDFGQFLYQLASEFLPQYEVRVFSRRQEQDRKVFFSLEEVCKSDFLIVCVPIAAFKETIENIKDLLGENTIVCDVSTVKVHTVSILRQLEVKNFIATHPMFGPYSYKKHNNSLQDLRITLCDHTLDPLQYQKVIQWLRSLGLRVLEMTANEHDKLVAETLFLTHLVGQTIKRGGFERTSIDTVSFGFLMDAVESVANDEALFLDVYKYNPYCEAVLERFRKADEDVRHILLK